MASKLDIQITPISRQGGKDQPGLPGLVLAQPSRKAARGRLNDHLILYLELTGNLDTSEIELASLLKKLEDTYYSNPGAISSTLRLAAEELNASLLQFNKRTNTYDRRITAALTQVVIRPDSFYMAQSGLVHAFFVTGSGVQHLYDPMFSGQGLGTAQSTAVRFFQGQFEPGDFLLLAARPSPMWTETSLAVFHGKEMEVMRRRLFDPGTANLSAVLIQSRPGEGRVQVVPFLIPVIMETAGQDTAGSAVSAVEKVPEPIPAAQQQPVDSDKPAPVSPPAPGETGGGQPDSLVGSQIPGETAEEIKTGKSQPEEPSNQQKLAQPASKSESAEHVEPVIAAQPVETKAKNPRKSTNMFFAALVTTGDAFTAFFQSLGRSFGRFFGRLFPDELLELSNTAMAVVAVLVPIVVVAGASLVYYQLGRAEQGRQLYLQAGETAAYALELEQPLEKRGELLTALGYLNQVGAYGGVPESQVDGLRFSLQNEIDRLDNIRRVDYKPAIINGLDESSRISRMLVSFDDLYLLDASSGSVLRTFETSQGYQLDENFRCGPQYATGNIGPLIGMVVWEGFDPDATIMAVDQAGNLLFCQPGNEPILAKLAPPSTGVFRSISALTMDRSLLYLLDPPGNAVWVYPIGELDAEPSFFFGDQPPPIQDAVDLAVNFDELYLLHKDGHLTLCYAYIQDISLPKCNAPQPFTDFRAGRENSSYIPESPFSQIFANPAPDPSLYLLEPAGQSVTHFSFRTLGYLREYAPLTPLPGGDATAFAVSGVDRLLFLAIGNQVYFGSMP